MSDPDLEGDLAELARIRVEIEQARVNQDIGSLGSLTRRRDELRVLLGIGQAGDPTLETTRLQHELSGLRQLVAEPPPDLGLSVACTSASAGGGSAAGNFPHGRYNRAVNNDASNGYRSRNSALERIAWIESRLDELGAGSGSQ